MRKLLVATAVLVIGAGSALSGEGRHVAGNSGVSEIILKDLEGAGYRVDRIDAKHGVYEVRAVNDSGFPIKADYDAAGELIRAALR